MSNEIKLGSDLFALTWDKGAIFRADSVGLWSGDGGIGFASAARYIWAMLPASGRKTYATPEAVAQVMPALNDAWPVINAAVADGGEGTDPKNVFGSTSGPLQSSS